MAPKRGAAKAEEDYENWGVAKLKERLKELGATQSGGKDALVARLRALADVAAAEAKAKGKAKAKGRAAAADVAESEPPSRGAAKGKAKAKAGTSSRTAVAEEDEEEKETPPPRGAAKGRAKAAGASSSTSEDALAGTKRKAPADSVASPKKAARSSGTSEAATVTEEDDAANNFVPSDEVEYVDGDFRAEYAKSNRSSCKLCHESIGASTLRLGQSVPSDKFDGNVVGWHHAKCFLGGKTLPRSTELIAGFSLLKKEDIAEIKKRVPVAGKGKDPTLDKQNEKLAGIGDVLRLLSEGQWKEMLALNGYPTKKKEGITTDYVDLIADGILFGATTPCGECEREVDGETKSGKMVLCGEHYKCTGWISSFMKCPVRTQTPKRVVWELTDAAKSAKDGFLGKMKLKTGNRRFASKLDTSAPPPTSSSSSAGPKPPLTNLAVAIIDESDNMNKADLIAYIRKHGGFYKESISQGTSCVVTSSQIAEDEPEEVQKAKELEVPGVEDTFLTDSVEQGEAQDMTYYLLWGTARARKKTIEEKSTSKFIEKEGVGIDADVGELVEKAHVLVDVSQKRVYSELMSKTDIATGMNSFYTVQLLESDDVSGEDNQYWVFTKWGRIGVSQGGTKIEDFSTNKFKAINKFASIYLDKTGNVFGHARDEFEAKPSKLMRVDVQHKALGQPAKKAKTGEEEDKPAAESGNDQPLGQLSKSQIEKGDGVLDKIEAILNEKDAGKDLSAVNLAKVQGFSAEYYSLIPHNFGLKMPPAISNPDLLGSEKALLQFYLRMGFEDIGQADVSLTPISGVMEQELKKTLLLAARNVCGLKDINSCTTKGDTMAKKKAGKPIKEMDKELYGSILLYTANAIYKDLNQCLRDENREKVQRYFPFLRMLFEACSRLPTRKVTLWRGVGVDLYDAYKVGSTIIWWGVSSCTSEEKVARDFMNGCGDAASLLTVETETACDISEVSFYSNEAESILLPGTKLEVLKADRKGKKSQITLREVGRVVT